MPSDAPKNMSESEIRQFRTLYLSIVTAGSNPEASMGRCVLVISSQRVELTSLVGCSTRYHKDASTASSRQSHQDSSDYR